jgi:hypothetical protein
MLKNITQHLSSVGAVYGSQSFEGSDQSFLAPGVLKGLTRRCGSQILEGPNEM